MLVSRTIKTAAAAVALGCAFAAPSHAAVVYATGANSNNIPALTGFSTNGAMMDGLSVTATFSSGFSQTLLWADTGLTSGGVSGTNWGVSLAGDSFSTDWIFTNTRDEQLTSLVLDGLAAFTVFDRTEPSFGTPGSAQGLDFNCSVCGGNNTVTVTYDYIVSVGAAAAVGDLWQMVTVDFGSSGPRTGFTFVQDTDNDIRITQVPEPGSLLLLSLGLAGLGFATRRRKLAG